jgi:acetyl-CoA acetyltransferase
MGALTDGANTCTRNEQDEFAVASHQRAAAAWMIGLFDDEVAAVGRDRQPFAMTVKISPLKMRT